MDTFPLPLVQLRGESLRPAAVRKYPGEPSPKGRRGAQDTKPAQQWGYRKPHHLWSEGTESDNFLPLRVTWAVLTKLGRSTANPRGEGPKAHAI